MTVELILDVATRLFIEKGFDKTSMRDIAKEAKLSKGAIYHYFASKNEIIEAVKERQTKSNTLTMESYLKEIVGYTGKEKLIAILKKSLESQENHYLDNLFSSQVKSSDFIVSYMKSCVEIDSALITDLIYQGIKDGSLSVDFPEEVAEVFLLLINIWCDPIIFKCNYSKLEQRLKFLQYMMKKVGLDILSDELLSKFLESLKKIYDKERTNE
jgi:hypothetical protein